MTYDIMDEIIDVTDYFLEEYGGDYHNCGSRKNPIHGTTITDLCKAARIDKRRMYGLRNGIPPLLNHKLCDILDLMGYEVHLIPKDKVNEVINICYEI